MNDVPGREAGNMTTAWTRILGLLCIGAGLVVLSNSTMKAVTKSPPTEPVVYKDATLDEKGRTGQDWAEWAADPSSAELPVEKSQRGKNLAIMWPTMVGGFLVVAGLLMWWRCRGPKSAEALRDPPR
jgi:hypothetical protein